MQSLEAFRATLAGGGDDDALDRAAEDVRKDGGAPALAEALRLRIAHERAQGKSELELTGLRFRLASALEEVARGPLSGDAGRAALEAAALQRDTLGDLDAASRNLALALRAGANDDALLTQALDVAGGAEAAQALLQAALKRKDIKADAALSASMRRAAQRLFEKAGDKDAAFFEALKAARKMPEEGLYIDEVFRLALEAKRDTEGAAFFQGLADDEQYADRLRASLYNKLGATRERMADKAGALAAYQASLFLRETKAARKNAKRLSLELGVSLGASIEIPVTDPPLAAPPAREDPEATLPPELQPELQPERQPSITPEEVPDITPTYPPNRAFKSMQVFEQVPHSSAHSGVSPFLESTEGEVEATDDLVISEELRDAARDGAPPPMVEVTLPRMTPGRDTIPLQATLEGPSGLSHRASPQTPLHPQQREPSLTPFVTEDVTVPAKNSAQPITEELSRRAAAPSPPASPVPALPPAVEEGGPLFDINAHPVSLPAVDEAPSVRAAGIHLADEQRGHDIRLPTRAPQTDEPTRRGLTAGLAAKASSELSVEGTASPSAILAPPLSPYGVPAAEATEQALPPLPLPPPTMQSMEAMDPIANALKVLEQGEPAACIAAAQALDEYAPGDARVLRLAAKALLQQAPSGSLSADAVGLFTKRADRHGDRAALLALDIKRELPPDRIRQHVGLWLAGARAAGQDVGRVLELLRELALEDAPDGPAFLHLERVLNANNDLEERDNLVLAALQATQGHANAVARRTALVRKRIVLLEQRGRTQETLPLWLELATSLDPEDKDIRRAARAAFQERGTPEERGRFLGKLSKLLQGDEGIEVLHEVLDLRMSVDDAVGAEAAARELLHKKPGDARATDVLLTLLERDPRRSEELIESQRRAAAAAVSVFGRTQEAKSHLSRLASLLERAGRSDEAAEALAQIARLAPDDTNIDVAIQALDAAKRHKEAVGLLEEISSSVADDRWRARLLVRAAELSRTRLMKRGKAREALERALGLDEDNAPALTMLAEILVEMGDGNGALQTLEKLLALTRDPIARAQLEVRIARLLEELLLRPESAITRYRAAVTADPSLREAWEALKTLARQRGDRPLLVDALSGLARQEQSAEERAALWRQIAKVERDERADSAAAEQAFRSALEAQPGDVEALTGLTTLIASRLNPEVDLDTALLNPSPELLVAVRASLARAAQGTELPVPLWRIDAAARAHAGDVDGAVTRFEALLARTPDDLQSLLQLSRLLATRGERSDDKRLRVLEQMLLHHAYSLQPAQQVEVWGDVTALRAAAGDHAGARKAAKKVMAIATTEETRRPLSDRAVRAVALALDDQQDAEREPRQVLAALRLDAARTSVNGERSRLLERAADIALREMNDRLLARQLLEEALLASPDSATARDALLDLEVTGGDINGVLEQLKELATREVDAKKRAALHLRRFRLMKKHGMEPAGVSRELSTALELDPSSREILDAAEAWFHEKNDAEGLDRLYSAQLRALDRQDVRGRLLLLERLAQLRRWERRDAAGAVEALEAMSALDPDALKPREDAARLYTELGLLKEAVNAWRGVLDRDAIVPEAWRGLFSLYARARQGDEAFAVASTMVALDMADEDIARVTKTLRPPFPRWPIPPKDSAAARKKVSHPLERTATRAILDATAQRLLPHYARSLKEFGFRRKDALKEQHIPTSVLLAVRTLTQLLGLPENPPLYAGTLGTTEGVPPPFAVLPSTEPGIVVAEEVLKGGITPERAFALGRAAAWLPPHALLAASLEAPQLRLIIEGLVCAFLGPNSLERPELEVERLAPELQRMLGLGSDAEAQRIKAELLPALRDYEHARAHQSASDFKAGVGYTADRYGFLVSTDLGSAVKVIKSGAAGGPSIGARLAVKELVLFSVSASYLSLRRELGLALPDAAAMPLLELD